MSRPPAPALVATSLVLVLAGCGDRKRTEPSPATGAGTGTATGTATSAPAAATPPPIDAATATPPAAGLDVQPIAAGAPLPPGAPARAVVIGGVRWVDRTGPGAVYLLEVASADRHTIALSVRSLAGADLRLVREIKDRADACPDRNLTAFAPPSVAVTDADGDGLAEVGFGYLVGCAGGAVVAKQLLLEGAAKYIVRGSAPDGGSPEPAIAQWPAGGFALADAAYRDNAGALDVADVTGAIAASGERVVYDLSTTVENVELDRMSGGVHIVLSYPKLPMLARSEAGDLTTRMRSFLSVDERWTRNYVGDHTGDCTIALITPEVASLDCDYLTDVRTRADFNNATGGSPAGETRTGLNLWRPSRDPITPAELGVPARFADCAWALELEGVALLRDFSADQVCAAETIAWADLAPTSDRAKAFVAAMQAPTPVP